MKPLPVKPTPPTPAKTVTAHAIAKRGPNYVLLRFEVPVEQGVRLGEPDVLAVIEGHAGDALIDNARQVVP